MLSKRSFATAWMACAILAACDAGNASSARATSESAPVEVRVALAQEAGWERSVPALGELAPFERVVVATKVPGRVAELDADRGDGVKKGAQLAALEAREYELRVQAAEAALRSARATLGLPPDGDVDAVEPEDTAVVRLARAELQRAKLDRERSLALAREGVDSQAVSDTAEAEFRAAESRLQEAFEQVAARRATVAQRRAELEIARAQFAETRIFAPFDGKVVQRRSAVGAYLAIGGELLELVRTDVLRLVLEVAERDGAEVRHGQEVRARVEGRKEPLTGKIVRIAPALAQASRSLVVEVDFPDPDSSLRPGAFAEARIVVAPQESVLTIPAECVVSFAGIDKVFVVREGKSEERRVTLGRQEGARAEVLAGLESGEEVVLAPGKLGGGTTVRVAR